VYFFRLSRVERDIKENLEHELNDIPIEGEFAVLNLKLEPSPDAYFPFLMSQYNLGKPNGSREASVRLTVTVAKKIFPAGADIDSRLITAEMEGLKAEVASQFGIDIDDVMVNLDISDYQMYISDEIHTDAATELPRHESPHRGYVRKPGRYLIMISPYSADSCLLVSDEYPVHLNSFAGTGLGYVDFSRAHSLKDRMLEFSYPDDAVCKVVVANLANLVDSRLNRNWPLTVEPTFGDGMTRSIYLSGKSEPVLFLQLGKNTDPLKDAVWTHGPVMVTDTSVFAFYETSLSSPERVDALHLTYSPSAELHEDDSATEVYSRNVLLEIPRSATAGGMMIARDVDIYEVTVLDSSSFVSKIELNPLTHSDTVVISGPMRFLLRKAADDIVVKFVKIQ